MPSRIPTIYITSAIWVLLMATALMTRPHLPVDETRYLAVAWEMWLRSDLPKAWSTSDMLLRD